MPDIVALTRGLVEGEDMAYHSFHGLYFGRLSRYLIVVTAGDEDAMREALQETYRRLVKHIRVFSNESVFWSWLTVVARSAVADQRRKRVRYLAFLNRYRSHARVIEPSVEGDHLGGALSRSLEHLPNEDRALLESKYFELESVSSIAQRLGTTAKAVESRLGRIRQKLKAIVLAELKHESPS